MKAYKNLILVMMLVFAGCLMVSFVAQQDKKLGGPWEVPAKYKAMKNTYKADASLEKVGKMLYAKYCKSCHGNVGEGDGPKAASMKVLIKSFKAADFQAQSDGVVYYQSFIGRDEMPNFESKIPEDEDRWAIVNYIRTLK